MSTIRLSRRAILRERCISFTSTCFSTPPTDLLEIHFIPDATIRNGINTPRTGPRITEHGPTPARDRLPFLARNFIGVQECLEYFTLLGKCLAFEPAKDAEGNEIDVWPGEEGFAIDPDAVVHANDGEQANEDEVGRGVVTVAGQGVFKSIKTGRSWEERFMHRFSGFDEQGHIGHWEIWADPLSAWLAVGDEDFHGDGRK